MADKEDLFSEYGIRTCKQEEIHDVDAIIVAVAHDEFRSLELEEIKQMIRPRTTLKTEGLVQAAATSENKSICGNDGCVLIDVKGIFDRKEAEEAGYLYWRM